MDREDLRKALDQAQEMQLNLVKAQAELAHTEINASTRNGKVTIVMTAQGEFKSVRIDPILLAEGLAAVEAGVLEALHNASEKAANLTKERLAQISSKMGL